MSNIIVDVKSARALVRFERDRNRIVYAEYIAANEVTLDTVAAHVKALAELAFPDFNADAADDVKSERKGFMNRVRNGLNHRLGKRTPSQERAETASTEDTDGEDTDGEDTATETAPATVEATPGQSVTLAVRAAVTAGMSRADILAAVEAGL